MKKIMLITDTLPIPAVRGGGIQELITNLIDVNEEERKVEFIVTSVDDSYAATYQYAHSVIYYFSGGKCKRLWAPFIRWKLFYVWLRIFQNRFTIHLFRRFADVRFVPFYIYQCYLIAIKEKVDIIIDECGQMPHMGIFKRRFGQENVYTHLHWALEDSTGVRRIVNNSISVSEYVKRNWIKNESIVGKNKVVYNGIRLEDFDNISTSDEQDNLKYELHIPPNAFICAFCGRWLEIKGIDQLLDAFDIIHDEDIFLLMIGGPDQVYPDYAKKVIQRIEKNPRIRNIGYIPNDELKTIYSIVDLLIVPSICQEGAGLVAVEGMAYGLPLIVTQSGGMTEYVNEECAIELPIDEYLSERIADEVVKLKNDLPRMYQMKEASKKRAKEFSMEHFYNHLLYSLLN